MDVDFCYGIRVYGYDGAQTTVYSDDYQLSEVQPSKAHFIETITQSFEDDDNTLPYTSHA